MNSDYILIKKVMLKDRGIFPFQLYVYNPQSQQYSPFLHGNRPLTPDKKDLMNFILDKGGSLAIATRQKQTFLKTMGLTENDLKSDQVILEEHSLEKERQIYQHIIEEREKTQGAYQFKQVFETAASTDDFQGIISQAHDEIMTFPITISHTVSLARHFCNILLHEDNFTNRIVAVSYFMAKMANISEEETLAEVICTAFLHHIGLTQIDLSLINTPYLKMSERQRKLYRKHPGLSHHLLRKSEVKLTSHCIQSIKDHHERYNGSGYPVGKVGQYITPVALIVGAVSHIFEYASGQITEEKKPIKTVMENLKNKSFTPGLEFQFGDTMYEALTNVMANITAKAA